MSHLSLEEFADRMGELMPKLMREIRQYEHNYFTRGIISFPQLWALECVYDRKDCTMRDLARAMHSGASTVTGLVTRMEKIGLLERKHSDKDRRVVYVHATPKGRRVIQQIGNQKKKTVTRAFKPLSEKDRKRYLEIMEKLVQELSEEKEGDHS